MFKNFEQFVVLFSNKMLVFRAGINKYLSGLQTVKTLNRLLLLQQSDLGLCCLWQATSEHLPCSGEFSCDKANLERNETAENS